MLCEARGPIEIGGHDVTTGQNPSQFEEAACATAREAGQVLLSRFRSAEPIEVEEKGLHDFVSEVDRAAERYQRAGPETGERPQRK